MTFDFFPQPSAGQKDIRMMMVFQCDNSRVNRDDVDTARTSTEGCQNDLGITFLHKKCESLVLRFRGSSAWCFAPTNL